MRIPQLDYLRGLAVLLVLGRHFDPLPTDLGWATPAMVAWLRCGWIGVDLFFVLSGFLVSGLLIREFRESGKVRVGRFLIRRGFKIYPAFYVLLGVTIVASLARGRMPAARSLLCEALYIQNYGAALWQHTWSLAAEEHFYLGLALITALVVSWPRLQRKYLLVTACVIGMAAVLTARICAWNLGYQTPGTYCRTHLRFDGFLAGVLLAYLYHCHRTALAASLGRHRLWLAIVGTLLVLPCAAYDVSHPAMLTVGFTALYIGFGLVLAAFLLGPESARTSTPWPLLLAPLSFIGVHSYSIYLWHIPVRRWVFPVIDRLNKAPLPGAWTIALYISLSVGVGYVMAKLVEIPFLRIRDRYFPGLTAYRAGNAVTESMPPTALCEPLKPSIITAPK